VSSSTSGSDGTPNPAGDSSAVNLVFRGVSFRVFMALAPSNELGNSRLAD
jgi:hypothetical protein